MRKRKVLSGCAIRTIWFDSRETYDQYIKGLMYKKKYFIVMCFDEGDDGTIIAKIKEQYNHVPLEGGE
jgi:hypothetical protein